ncbi:diguanylate cyclase domain-containing protein [Arcobacter sp. CECT 8983]|uniref:sensor domain-containing diguanylate cyclase n=1 Tax=Arcobacter sp. CECT 8983 TaxID=2044508 RepID=UPI002159C764|nr:diguanylate cyclase [Arcobacter sp. CECT 8983]
MNNNLKILFIAFILTTVTFVTIIVYLTNNKIEQQLESEKEILDVTYKTIIDSYKTNANIIYFNKLDTKEVKKLLFNAYESNDFQKSKIREKLYKKLIYMYENMYSFKIKQLHFHLKNNDSFLRFHRPEKFGDNLSNIRATVKYTNEKQQAIQGFEEGRIFNGYRFVYPLSYKMKYLGSVEISVSMDAIIKSLNKELKADIDFIIKKDVVDNKVFNSEKSNYRVCETNSDYYHEKNISKKKNIIIEDITANYINTNKEKFLAKKNSDKIFNFTSTYEDKRYITTYLPIKNAISKEKVAYLIITREHANLQGAINKLNISMIFFIVLNSLFFYFLFKSEKRKILLKHKDEILSELQEMGHIGYWERDNIKEKLTWSKELFEILEIRKDEVKPSYKNFMKFIHKDDLKRINTIYKEFLKNLIDYKTEFKITTTTGKVKFIEQEAHHIINDEGKAIRSIGTLRDVTEVKKFQIEAEHSKKEFEILVSNIPDIVYKREIDKQQTITYLNNSLKSILGYENEDLLFNNKISFSQIVDEEDLPHVEYSLKNLAKSNTTKPITLKYRLKQKSGDLIWVSDRFKIMKKDNKKYLEGIISDINSQKNAYDKLYKFIDLQQNIVILTDGKKLQFANKSFFQFFNYRNLSHFLQDYNCICELFLEDNNYFNLTKIENHNEWVQELQKLPQTSRIVAINDNNGRKKSFSVTINSFETSLYIVSFTDITETILMNQELQQKTIHDKLTNAYNREYFEIINNKFIHDANKNPSSSFALCLIDIDFFKKVNDTYGHDVGDITLIALVKIINSSIRKDDVLVRWGGEEFILLMKNLSDETLKNSLEHIKSVIEKYEFETIKKLTCSFGATIYKKDENIKNTIKRADINLYTAKKTGRNKIVIS